MMTNDAERLRARANEQEVMDAILAADTPRRREPNCVILTLRVERPNTI
jgi:hypothetical protein